MRVYGLLVCFITIWVFLMSFMPWRPELTGDALVIVVGQMIIVALVPPILYLVISDLTRR